MINVLYNIKSVQLARGSGSPPIWCPAAKIGKAGSWADRGTWHGHAPGIPWQQAAASPRRAFLEDLRGVNARIRKACKKLATAIAATGTSLTRLFGAGPGFADRDHFAVYDGTAPIEVSSN